MIGVVMLDGLDIREFEMQRHISAMNLGGKLERKIIVRNVLRKIHL